MVNSLDIRLNQHRSAALGIFRIVIGLLWALHGTSKLFNLPPGNWAAGERGMSCLHDRREEFKQTIDTALVYAQATGVKNLHIMAGIEPAGCDLKLLHRTYIGLAKSNQRPSIQGE